MQNRLVAFTKKRPSDKVWDADVLTEDGNVEIGPVYFSFDRKTIYNFWPDYPDNLTAEQKWLFDDANPEWAKLRASEDEIKQLEKEHPAWKEYDDDIDTEMDYTMQEIRFFGEE